MKKEEEEFRANKQKEITKTKTETKNHNYNNNYNKDRTPKVVTRYHNSFNEHFRKYSEVGDELIERFCSKGNLVFIPAKKR